MNDAGRVRSRKIIIMITIVIMLSTSAARCELNQILGSGFWSSGEEGIVVVSSGEDQGQGYLSDDSDGGGSTGSSSSSGQSGPLKPVGFRNYGEFDAVVMPYTYIPLGGADQVQPAQASTVSSANDGVGDWPNTSRFLLLPEGTYTWCVDWEEGDLDEDGDIDYFHYIQGDPTVLDEHDSDQTEFAEEVAISAPPSSGMIYEGRCQPSKVDTSCSDDEIKVNVYPYYALEQENKPDVKVIPNTVEESPPDGIEVTHGGNSTGWGNNIILWSEGDFAQAGTANPYSAFGAQIHGDQTIGWARILFDGQEIWRGDTSTYVIAEGRYGVYVEVLCYPAGYHLIRVEGLGVNGSGGGSSIPVSYFGFMD